MHTSADRPARVVGDTSETCACSIRVRNRPYDLPDEVSGRAQGNRKQRAFDDDERQGAASLRAVSSIDQTARVGTGRVPSR